MSSDPIHVCVCVFVCARTKPTCATWSKRSNAVTRWAQSVWVFSSKVHRRLLFESPCCRKHRLIASEERLDADTWTPFGAGMAATVAKRYARGSLQS
jgi:hypothetical protein